ncbi:MAG: hypothetical protein WC379_09025 [Methanoregula sp.]
MFNRMYILLTRPKQAIGEFGAGDYRTPVLFFLFFTIIFTFLQGIASDLRFAVIMASWGQGAARADISEVLDIFIQFSPMNMIIPLLERSLYSCLGLGFTVLVLVLLLWAVTGIRSWNPAFTISAYSLPVSSLIFTIHGILAIPMPFNNPVFDGISLIFIIAGFGAAVIIAAYGLSILGKIPLTTAVIVALSGILIGVFMTSTFWVMVIHPAISSLDLLIKQVFFPPIEGYPTAAALGKNP